MVVVSNSSPLIALARIQRVGLLPALFESVLIPPAVVHEIGPAIPTWLQLRTLGTSMPEHLSRRRLGDGELEAIALAIECNADQIILDNELLRSVGEA